MVARFKDHRFKEKLTSKLRIFIQFSLAYTHTCIYIYIYVYIYIYIQHGPHYFCHTYSRFDSLIKTCQHVSPHRQIYTKKHIRRRFGQQLLSMHKVLNCAIMTDVYIIISVAISFALLQNTGGYSSYLINHSYHVQLSFWTNIIGFQRASSLYQLWMASLFIAVTPDTVAEGQKSLMNEF